MHNETFDGLLGPLLLWVIGEATIAKTFSGMNDAHVSNTAYLEEQSESP